MSVSPELRAASRKLREVRSQKPSGQILSEPYAAWRVKIADALDSLALVLTHQEDREKAASEAAAARAEAARIRADVKNDRETEHGNRDSRPGSPAG